MQKLLSIRQAGAASGLPADTIRYYEKLGILPTVGRDANGYRRYLPEHLETLRFTRSLRELGLTPDAMKPLVQLFHDGTCREMRTALLENCHTALVKVRAQRLELDHLESQLVRVTDGLELQSPDGRGISTIRPCGCVSVLQERREANV